MANKVVLGAAILTRTLKRQSFETLGDIVYAVMKKAQDQSVIWFGDEDEKFRCAIGAIGMLANPEDKLRVEHEIKLMRILSLTLSGVDVDMNKIIMNEYEPVGLQATWDRLRKGGPDA